jgi:hypothetical protein
MLTHMRTLILIALLAGAFVAVPDVHAHRPEPGSAVGVTLIPDPTTSYAYYRQLRAPDEIHVYQVEARAGQFFHAGINVPQIEGLEHYGVTLALLGPGLPPLAEDQLPFHHAADEHTDHDEPSHRDVQLPDSLLADLQSGASGGLVVASVASAAFYEPFTQTRYWGRQELDLDLPASGTYYLLVWNPDGASGKYVLDTGTKEVFGPTDLLRFPLWWLQTRIYFEQLPHIIGTLMLLFSGGLGFIVYRRRA